MTDISATFGPSSISRETLFVSRTYESDLRKLIGLFCRGVIGFKCQKAKQTNSKKDEAYQQTSR